MIYLCRLTAESSPVVTLDGKPVSCVLADEEAGVIYRLIEEPLDDADVNPGQFARFRYRHGEHGFELERIEGEVKIRWPRRVVYSGTIANPGDDLKMSRTVIF